MRTFWLLISPLLLLTGCAGLQVPTDPARMSAEQLHEWVKDKNANVSCTIVSNPMYGRLTHTSIVLDKGTVINGALMVDPETCKTTITNVVTPKP